jgi:hypothetical protein
MLTHNSSINIVHCWFSVFDIPAGGGYGKYTEKY